MLATNLRSTLLAGVWAMVALLVAAAPAWAQRDPWTWVERFEFTIDPKTPLKELLPVPPQAGSGGKLLVADLALVREVQFAQPYAFKSASKDGKEMEKAQQKALIAIAHQFAKINFLNQKKTDHFMERLVENRPDLSGLPFTLGQTCRLDADEKARFRHEAALLRSRLAEFAEFKDRPVLSRNAVTTFWDGYNHDRKKVKLEAVKSDATRAIEERCAVGVAMQMIGPDPGSLHPGLIQHLAAFEKTDAGKEHSSDALARLAVYSLEEETRKAAVAALQKRGGDAGKAMLPRGLRYPWPAAAKNAADAIAQLKRTELIPELLKMLDEPDPRAPTLQTIDGKTTPVVRELVRINHHRNCMLCHPPGNTPDIFGKIMDGKMGPLENGMRTGHVGLDHLHVGSEHGAAPVPGVKFPPPSDGYGRFSAPDILVRADVTYLRQDFSLVQKVANAEPWPELQRFDFLVRTRVLTEQEAKAYQAEFADGAPSPYRQAALSALRRLTGQDAGTTAKEWRAALKLP